MVRDCAEGSKFLWLGIKVRDRPFLSLTTWLGIENPIPNREILSLTLSLTVLSIPNRAIPNRTFYP